MAIKETLIRLAKDFANEREKSPVVNGQKRIPKKHPISHYVNNSIPEIFNKALGKNIKSCVVSASVGITNWRKDGPWIAFLHPSITNSARKGYYPVYLFSRDLKTILLELGQGEEEVKQQYKKEAKFLLQSRAAILRNKIPTYKNYFKIINSPKIKRQDWLVYGAFGKFYQLNNLPDEKSIVQDLKQMISLYIQTIRLGGIFENITLEDVETENTKLTGKEKKQIREHKKQESIVSYRDTKFINQLKKERNYTCEACGMYFKKIYGEYQGNTEFIEAHHIIPISNLKVGEEIERKKEDFAILCSNCHRMIHRYGVPSLNEFKMKIKKEYIDFIRKI